MGSTIHRKTDHKALSFLFTISENTVIMKIYANNRLNERIRVEDENEDNTDEDYFSDYVMFFAYSNDYWGVGIDKFDTYGRR